MPSSRQPADPGQGPGHVLDAEGVVVGADAVLGDVDRQPAGHLGGPADGGAQRLGPHLVAHLGGARRRPRSRAPRRGRPASGCRSGRRRSRRRRVASRNTSSLGRRRRSSHSSPPGWSWKSVIETVIPTGKSPGPERMASTALRWADDHGGVDHVRRVRSRTRGGNSPWRHPMVATTLGSLRVQAMPIRSPRWAVTFSQKRANRSGACSASHVPAAASQRGWVKWWKVTTGRIPCLVAGGGHPAVVVEGHPRELPLLRLDPAPLEREAVGAEAEAGDQGDVLGIAVERVAGVAADVHAARRRVVLHGPPVVVDVAPLDLVGGGGGPPEEPVGEGHLGHGAHRSGGPRRRQAAGRHPPCAVRRHAVRPDRMRAVSDALELLVELLDLEPIEVNIFRGSNPNEERQRIFGGQVAAQALMAAGRTVEVGRPHSLHAYFLRPGDPNVPVLYEVDRIRDGRSFTTRRVVAIQHGRAIFHLSASFHVDEPGLEFQIPMPEVPDPETLPTMRERLEPYKDKVGDWYDRPHPIDQRHIGALPWMHRAGPGAPPAAVAAGRRHAARRPAAPHLHRHLRVGHVPVRHHARPPRRGLGRPRLHGGQPRPLHVVPPAVPGRRVAALRHGQPDVVGGPGPGPGLHVHPGGDAGRVHGPGGPDAPGGPRPTGS